MDHDHDGAIRRVGRASVPAPRHSTPVERPLIAYRLNRHWPMRIVPAPAARDWIGATPEHFARRCLPLLIANQAGWFVLNSHPVRAVWNGGPQLGDLVVEHLGGDPPYPASSHFGSGILTFNLPFLFRTPRGVDLLARGPANWPKDGASPLEGIVETDWAEATFTMNWKLTRPNLAVEFGLDEPICMVVPQPRGALESYAPCVRPVSDDPALNAGHRVWSDSRTRHNVGLKVPGSMAAVAGWEKHYMRGVAPSGARATGHRTALRLQEFDEPDGICAPVTPGSPDAPSVD